MAKKLNTRPIDVAKRLIAMMLVLALAILVGCESNETSSKDPTSSKPNKNNSSNVQSSEPEKVDPLKGKVSVGLEVDSQIPRDDFGEIIPENGIANMKDKKTGVADAEADALRQKILNTGNTEEYYKITGTKYYISPGGNDENKGTSPQEAFRSIEALTNIKLKPGDAVLFERNSVFRFTSTFNTSEGVIYGSYGKGDKPKIYGSGENFAEATWTPTNRKNIWRTIYIYDPVGTMVFDHGEEVGCKRTSLRTLTGNGQYYYSEEDGYIYLYSDKGNPAALYDSIEITADVRLFLIPSRKGNVVIDNLCLMYSSSFAVSGNYNCGKVTVTNCEIGYIGGYMRNGTTRLGNAIQMWTGTKDGLIVKNNWIYQTFDTAVTWQGNGGEGFEYNDIQIDGNLFEYNHTDIEFWDTGAKLGDFAITNNIFRLTQMGWGARKEDAGIRGFDGIIYGTTSDMNVVGTMTFKNNLIDSPGGRIFKWTTKQGDWDKHFDVSGNRLYVTGAYRYDTQVTRATYGNAADNENQFATNESELLAAFKRIDPTIQVKWK